MGYSLLLFGEDPHFSDGVITCDSKILPKVRNPENFIHSDESGLDRLLLRRN